MHCPSCGLPLAADPESRKGEARELICAECGARLEYERYRGKGDPPPAGEPGDSEPAVCQPKKEGATTLFQPRLMIESIFDEELGPEEPEGTAPRLPTTATVPLALGLAMDVYFLVLGAPPGQERLTLRQARTVLGREEADLVIDDPAVSARHCQIDVMGKEFYVRDLGSRNGTLLNGHPVRYSELLPGDELRLGDTVLVFRTSKDGLSDRP